MNAILFIRKMSYFVFFSFLFFSCSKEDLNEEILQNEALTEDLELTSTVTTSSSCSTSYTPDWRYGQVVINSGTYKTLKSYTLQSDTHLTVKAEYAISLSKDDLPATITIEINGNQQVFKDVHPGSSVSHSVELPIGWQGGDAVPYMVEQKAFLEPVKIEYSYILSQPCPVELGTIRYGGLVVHIYSPGEDGYKEGETHGIILDISPNPPSFPWAEAMKWANNLTTNGYDDWTVPPANTLEKLMNLGSYFSYDFYLQYGYWSSTENGSSVGSAYGGTYQGGGFFGQPLEVVIQPFSKTSNLLVRTVRYF